MDVVLVAFASKMGGTKEIATRLAGAMKDRGLEVDLLPAEVVDSFSDYGAMVLGSAIYNTKWRPEMVRLMERLVVSAYTRPIWLFHSGPLGDEHADDTQPLPRKVADMAEALNVKRVTTFGGRMPEHPDGLMAKIVAKSNAGDWRDFGKVDELAESIAGALAASDSPV